MAHRTQEEEFEEEIPSNKQESYLYWLACKNVEAAIGRGVTGRMFRWQKNVRAAIGWPRVRGRGDSYRRIEENRGSYGVRSRRSGVLT